MRKGQQGPAGVVRVDEASSASAFRELDDAFLQTQTKIWLGEVLHLRFHEDISVAELLADGELLFQVSKVIWKRLLKKNREQLKQSKVYIYERLSFGKSSGKYVPYSKVDSFLKICQILELAGIDLFTPSDVVEKRNVRKVPDFDIVTYTISMPNYIVGGIRRTLEQPQYSSSSSSGYSPRANSKALHQQIIFGGQNDQNGDKHYDSDEAESRLSVLEPEDSVDEGNFADILLQLSDAPKEGNEGYGENGHDTHEEKSIAESVGSPNRGVVDSDSVDSTPLLQSKESCCSTQSATDRCSRTRMTNCSLSLQESDSVRSSLAFDIDKNELELEAPPAAISERIHDGHVKPINHSVPRDVETFADGSNIGIVDLQKDTGILDRRYDALACDRESVCSSCKELRYGLNGELSDWSSGLTPIHDTDGELPMVSVDSIPLLLSKESCCSTQTATDRCSRTRMTLSSEESDSVRSPLTFDSDKNDLELEDPPAVISERIHDGHVKPTNHSDPRGVEIFADGPNNGIVDPHRDTGILDRRCDALACDRKSICSSCEEPRYGLDDEPSDWSSGLTPIHDTDGKLLIVSEDPTNNTEPSTNNMIPAIGTTNDSTSQELNPEFSTEDDAGDKSVHKSEDIAESSISPPHKAVDVAPKSVKGMLKSVAGGITLVGAVFFIVHLRRSKEGNFTSFVPWLSEKPVQSKDSRTKNMDKGKAAAVYPGERLKV